MKYRKMILGALVAVMLGFCGHLDTYSETVTATENTITATDRNGATVTLTECRTDDGDRLLLEGVEEGHRYRVRARDQMTFYHGQRKMLEAVSGCVVCVDTDGKHHAIKTNGNGDALRDSLQPFDRDRADNAPIIFATKRDKTYNRRKYLAVDTDAQTFTTEPPRAWYIRDELIEIGSRDLAKLAEALTVRGYEER